MLNNPLALAALVGALSCFAGFFVLNHMVGQGTTAAFDRRGIKALRLPSGKPRSGMAVAPVMLVLTQLGGLCCDMQLRFPRPSRSIGWV